MIKRCLAIVLSLCLANQTIGFAEKDLPVGDKLSPPKELGSIISSHLVDSNEMVILIQDLHANPSVQASIKGLLEYFTRRGFGQSLYVEGASGRVDSSLLAALPAGPDKDKICEDLVQSADLTGAEWFAAESGNPYMLLGLENDGVYQQHLMAYKESFDDRKALAKVLRESRHTARDHVWTFDNPRLRQIVVNHEAFLDGKRDFLDYFRFISRESRHLRISLDSRYPELSRLRGLAAGRIKSNLGFDFSKASVQVTDLSRRVCLEMAETQIERNDIELLFGVDAISKMLSNSITTDEVEWILPEIPSLTKRMSEFLSRDVSDVMSSALEFYRLAYERDQSMAQKIYETMPSSGTVIAITGGFHSRHIAEILAEHGIGSIIVSPNVQDHTKQDEDLYVSKLMAQTNTLAMAINQEQNAIFAKNIVLELHSELKNPPKVVKWWNREIAPKIESWGAEMGLPASSFTRRPKLKTAKIVSVNEGYAVTLESWEKGTEIVMIYPSKSEPYKWNVIPVSRFMKMWTFLIVALPLFLATSCGYREPAPIIIPPQPVVVKNAPDPVDLARARELSNKIQKVFSHRVLFKNFIREYPDKAELERDAKLMGKYAENFIEEPGTDPVLHLPITTLREASKEILDELAKIKAKTLESKKEVWRPAGTKSSPYPEALMPKPQPQAMPPGAPPMNMIPQQPPKSRVRQQIEDIENELKKDEAEAKAQREKFSWSEAVRKELDMKFGYAWRVKVSQFIVEGFFAMQLLFVMVSLAVLSLRSAFDRVQRLKRTLTQKLPYLKSFSFVVWILAVMGFAVRAMHNSTGVLHADQVVMAIIGGALTFVMAFKGDKTSKDFRRSSRTTGNATVTAVVALTAAAIFIPLAIKNQAGGWLIALAGVYLLQLSHKGYKSFIAPDRLKSHLFQQA